MVESKIDKYGRRGTMRILQSWSNGYVSTRQIDSEPIG